MFSIAVVEDEKTSSDLIVSFIMKFFAENPEEAEVVHFKGGVQFLDNFHHNYDIVFLDTAMQFLSGLDVAKQIRNIDESVCLVFMSEDPQQAIYGYEVSAINFLLKPVVYTQLAITLGDAIKHVTENKSASFFIKSDDEYIRIFYNKLKYVEVDNHWLVYHTVRKDYRIRGSFKTIKEHLLEQGFAQCNSCYLVNMDYIDSIMGNVISIDGDSLQISHSRKKEFLAKFSKYIQKSARNVAVNSLRQ